MPNARTFTYHWWHIPTGATGSRTLTSGEWSDSHVGPDVLRIYSRNDLLNAVNAWNRLGGITWKYWTED